MNRLQRTVCTLGVFLFLATGAARSAVVGSDNFDDPGTYASRTIVGGANTSGGITWNVVSRDNITYPGMIDTSVAAGGVVGLTTNDVSGFLGTNKTDNIFGMYRAGQSGPRTLTYTFDITNYTNLNLLVDWATSGNANGDKNVSISSVIDGGATNMILDIGKSTAGWTETMDNGTTILRADSFTMSVNGVATNSLSDEFQTYNPQIDGTGSELALIITMLSGVGGFGGMGMDNLILNGTVIPSANHETTYQSSSSNRLGTVAANWNNGLPGQTNTLSGATTNERAFLVNGDVAYIFSAMPAPLTAYDLLIGDDTSGGTLNVQANMSGLNDVEIGASQNANGSWIQTAGTADAASVRVGNALGTGSPVFKLSGGSFSTSGDVAIETTGTLDYDARDVALTVGNDFVMDGALAITLGERGGNPVDVGGALSIDSSTAQLSVDLFLYIGGPRTVELIQCGSLNGTFDTNNISFRGLRAGVSASISYDADSVNLIVTEEPETATDFWFSQKAWAGTGAATQDDIILNNGRALLDLDVPGWSCSQTNEGNSLLYSIIWTGSDFDGDLTNDTLSFDLRVEGFAGSTYTYSTNAGESSMTALGGSTDVTDINNTWGVGGDYDVDAGQSLRFSVTNAQVSVPGYLVDFEGVGGVTVIESNGGHSHRLVLGEGTGLDGKQFSTPTATYTFSSTDSFVVTGAGSFYAGSREWAVSAINYKLRVYDPGQSYTEDLTDYSKFVTGPTYGAEYPEQASTSNYPAFSWDTIPRWLIIRKGSAYTDAEVNSMATNFNLIVWEKANAAGFGSIEEGIADTAARIRAVDPTTKNIFYFNSYIHYGGYAAHANYDDWAWSNHTVDTNGVESIFKFKNLYSTHNYAIPELRDWWVNTMLGMTSNSAIDGVFIDKVTTSLPYMYDESGEPVTDYFKMLDQLEQGLPEGKLFMGNTLRNERNCGGRAYMETQEGSYMERWTLTDNSNTPAQSGAEALAVTIQLMREALLKGKIITLRSGGPETSQAELEAAVDFDLAVYLTVAETNAYFAHQGTVDATHATWAWDTSWMDVFNRPLGPPQGPPVQNGTIYTRSFEHLDVMVDVETRETSFAWDSVDTDADGLNDLWEYRNFGNTTNAAASANPDGDAYTNEEEYIAGLNPNVFDTFAVSDFTTGASNAFEWDEVSGRLYNVYWSSNLLDGFMLIESNVPGGTFSDTNHTGDAAGFYKITVELE